MVVYTPVISGGLRKEIWECEASLNVWPCLKTKRTQVTPVTWVVRRSQPLEEQGDRKEVSFRPWPASSNAKEEVCMAVYLDFHRHFVGKEGSIHRCPLPIVFLTYPALFHDAPDLLLLTGSKAAVCGWPWRTMGCLCVWLPDQTVSFLRAVKFVAPQDTAWDCHTQYFCLAIEWTTVDIYCVHSRYQALHYLT